MWAAVLWASLVVTVAAALGIPAHATDAARTSGDEPHYLLTAEAIGRHGTLDLRDAYAQQRYRPYHDAALQPQGRPLSDGRVVAPHDPLLPLLLALPMRLGGWVGAKLALAVMAGVLAGTLVWGAARRLRVPPSRAAATVAVLAASPPLASYGSQVYPELPAALAIALALCALLGTFRRGSQLLLLATVVALPWLSVKYAPAAAVLAVIGLVRLGRARGWRWVTGAVAALAAAGALYLAAHLAWYEGVTVYAAGRFFADHGGQLSVVGTRPDYLGRSVRLLALLVDRDFGLAAWQPAWLLALPAAAALAARRDHERTLARTALLAILGTGWLVGTFVAATMHGWWLPGRHVAAVLPAAVLLIAWWARDGGIRYAAALTLGAVGVLAHVWLSVESAFGGLPLIVDFASSGNPLAGGWRALLPDYRAPSSATWLLHGAWCAAAIALALAGWRPAATRAR